MPNTTFALRQPAIRLFFVIVLVALVAPAHASTSFVLNGSFETLAASSTLQSPGGYICEAGSPSTCVSNMADWASTCHGSTCDTSATVASLVFPGTNGSAFNGGIGLWGTIPNSPDGGNFVAIDGDPQFNASISQMINNLNPGVTYYLQFYQAAAQQKGSSGATTEQWQVTLGGTTVDSPVMDNATHGFIPWVQETISFQASATSEVLTFLALGTPAGEPPVVLLDGVSLSTPEPATLGLLGGGLLVLFAARKRR